MLFIFLSEEKYFNIMMANRVIIFEDTSPCTPKLWEKEERVAKYHIDMLSQVVDKMTSGIDCWLEKMSETITSFEKKADLKMQAMARTNYTNENGNQLLIYIPDCKNY